MRTMALKAAFMPCESPPLVRTASDLPANWSLLTDLASSLSKMPIFELDDKNEASFKTII